MGPEHASPMDQIRQEQMILQEKRRRRRESHNAVERRRRDVINDRIQELANLLPQNSIPAHKFNKGTILTQSVNYIKYLQDVLKQHSIDDHSFAAQTWDQLDLTNANFGSVIPSTSVVTPANPSRATSHLLDAQNQMPTTNN
ncbi:HLH-domain-containing protein [Conidiobolus coronatus NRRL 28638]|uniref:HLH-domain-containing protein n=1 Tax=Conidiobolus coronatus (strain ATCC 28846 / CBS 209.66 / NRRL 28638) TaxID=796925 RepID=A0A137P784_CONC2|nr:HLH-domain-containing protein [Conidiobolus coronatus NRRL 28638]|eukprot:KXN70862.1 HLH-domain-containing protein [Conidiobolus coronatus NRRL 28638]